MAEGGSTTADAAAAGSSPDPAAARRAQQSAWMPLIAAGGRARDAALRQMHDAYDRRVMSLCMWRFRLSEADAEDVWQDVVLSICEHAHEFRAGADPAPWILRMVENKAKDLLSEAWRRHRVDHGADEVPEIEVPGTQGQPQRLAADECVQRGLRDFARAFPEEARAIALRDLEEWGVPKLAAFLGRSQDATRSYLVTLRKKLKPFLEPCLDLLPP
jgi:RNA polymerase sigma-70 factor (ECF subfamily)